MFFLLENDNPSLTQKLRAHLNYYNRPYQGNISEDIFLDEVFNDAGLVLKLDKGWNKYEDDNRVTWYKGYSHEVSLKDIVEKADFKSRKGNYLCLNFDKVKNIFHVYRDDLIGFNLFYSPQYITNLYPLERQVDYNEDIGLIKEQEKFWRIEISNASPPHSFPENYKNDLSISQAAEKLKDLLIKNMESFFAHNDFDNIEVQFSGGLDTTLLCALLNFLGRPYELIDVRGKEDINWSPGTNPLMDHLSSFSWGFKQSHFYPPQEKHTVVSGFWGDEFLMRNPMYVHWILKYNGIKLLDEIKNYPNAYMTNFIKTDYIEKIKKFDYAFDSTKKLYTEVKEWCLRDYQTNHLNNTIMYTPFKDRDILDLSFQLSNEAILSQVIRGELQFEIIKSLQPSLLKEIDRTKNNR